MASEGQIIALIEQERMICLALAQQVIVMMNNDIPTPELENELQSSINRINELRAQLPPYRRDYV